MVARLGPTLPLDGLSVETHNTGIAPAFCLNDQNCKGRTDHDTCRPKTPFWKTTIIGLSCDTIADTNADVPVSKYLRRPSQFDALVRGGHRERVSMLKYGWQSGQ